MSEISSNLPVPDNTHTPVAATVPHGKEEKEPKIKTVMGQIPSHSLPLSKRLANGASQLSKNMKFLFVGIPKTMVNMCRDEDAKGNKKFSPSGIATLALGSAFFVPTLLAISPILLGTALLDSA